MPISSDSIPLCCFCAVALLILKLRCGAVDLETALLICAVALLVCTALLYPRGRSWLIYLLVRPLVYVETLAGFGARCVEFYTLEHFLPTRDILPAAPVKFRTRDIWIKKIYFNIKYSNVVCAKTQYRMNLLLTYFITLQVFARSYASFHKAANCRVLLLSSAFPWVRPPACLWICYLVPT